ncbi:MAG: ABC transporter ATP-binding protein [Oceanospirillaceae bacterium]
MNPSEKANTSSEYAPWLDDNVKPIIRFENVTKKYGDFTAIDNLTLNIYEREFYSLLGPSGCGKTTLMRLLAGFETPTSGRIFIGDEDMSTVPPNKRPVNMMFQSYALFPHMTVAENIAFGLKQEKRPAKEIRRRVDEMLALVQLEALANRKPQQLSGGQRQRVALARALAKKPKLLLLDEPLGALDKKLREQTQFELMNLQEDLGVTFVIVTHDQEEAMTVSSRIAIMNHGQVMQVDTPDMIYEMPKSRYVADFIGDVNIIEGTCIKTAVNAENNSAHFSTPTQNDLIANTEKTLSVDDQVWLALRPEKIEISKEKPQGQQNLIKGKVWDIAYIGNTSTYHVQLEDGSTIKAQRVNRNRLNKRSITWEDEVWLYWNLDACVVLTQ